jgi:Transglycosylase-like domain
MSERTDHPPSHGDQPDDQPPTRPVGRAVVGGVLGLALLLVPVALATIVLPDGGGDDRVEAAGDTGDGQDDSDTSLIHVQRPSTSLDFDKAHALALRRPTTTTTAPPTTTTTAPPTTTTEPPPPPTTEEPPPTTEEPPPTEPPPAPEPDNGGGLGDPNSYATWDALAECESGGDWHINTGNGYYGGLQFSLDTWHGVGGTGYPHEHSRETQIAMGQRLYASSGWGAWPACTSKLGWR